MPFVEHGSGSRNIVLLSSRCKQKKQCHEKIFSSQHDYFFF
jgi:hypothetical protein